MMFSSSAARGSRYINALALAGVTSALIFASTWQFMYKELPCPLCLLQRLALVMAGVGLALNVRLGPSPLHYAMVIAAALGGALAAGREVLLHIAPGDPGDGSPLLGLHFYTWALLACIALVAYCAVMLAVDRKWGDHAQKKPLPVVSALVLGLFFVVTVANMGLVTLECGFGACPDNPVAYQLLAPARP